MTSMSRPTAAFFDLDKTIIAKSSTLAFSREFQAGGLISRRAMLRSAYAQFVFFTGGADHDQMDKMREFMSQLCAGWDVATVREIVHDTLNNIVEPLVYAEAVTLMEEHREAGRDIVIVSASGAEVVEPIGQMLGADRVVATRMEIVDGKYTGNIDYYAYAEEKARAIEHLAETVGYDLAESYAYSDSVTDVHMLQVVGHPLRGQPRPRAAPHRDRQRVAGPELRTPRGAAPARPAAAREADPRGPRRRRRGRCRRRHLGQPAPSRRGLRRPTDQYPAHPPAGAKVNPCRSGGTGLELRSELHSQHVNRVPTRRSTHPMGC